LEAGIGAELLEAGVTLEQFSCCSAVLLNHALCGFPEGRLILKQQLDDGEVGFGLEVLGLELDELFEGGLGDLIVALFAENFNELGEKFRAGFWVVNEGVGDVVGLLFTAEGVVEALQA